MLDAGIPWHVSVRARTLKLFSDQAWANYMRRYWESQGISWEEQMALAEEVEAQEAAERRGAR
jgi:hypothetical protein